MVFTIADLKILQLQPVKLKSGEALKLLDCDCCCLWTVPGLSLDCLWTVSGLSMDCLWSISGLPLD